MFHQKKFFNVITVRLKSHVKESDGIPSCGPIFGFLVPGTNLLKLLTSSRDRSKPTDRFRQILTLGSHRIPILGIRMSVHSPESHWILSGGWIRCRIV
jgi:hypothetical protein